eukprot:5740682-Amphidinium_carterae.1
MLHSKPAALCPSLPGEAFKLEAKVLAIVIGGRRMTTKNSQCRQSRADFRSKGAPSLCATCQSETVPAPLTDTITVYTEPEGLELHCK